MTGFIKLHRKLLEWGWYSDANTFRVFMHLLLTASYEENEFRGEKIKPGETVFGRKKLAKELGISEQSVRTALSHLISTNEITIRVTNRFSIATIENWAKYQCKDDESNQQANQQANQQSTNNQPTINHTQEIKKVRNKEKYKKEDDLFEDVPQEIKPEFMEWVAMRKRKKKPVESKLAVTRALNKLKSLTENTEKQKELIAYAIFKNWESFYPIPEGDKIPKKKVETKKEPIDAVEMTDEQRAKISETLSGLYL